MKSLLILCTTFIFSNGVLAADATTELERKNLIAIAKQLNALHELANEAEAAADNSARVKFNYQAFHRDINAMNQAIENHLNKPSRTPRAIPDLNQDYSH